MSERRNESKAMVLFIALTVAGAGLLVIPFFLTPPAFLDLALRDAAFGTDLTARNVTITDTTTGKAMSLPIRRVGKLFVARVGRINSGPGTYTARLDGYKPGTARVNAAALASLRVPVDLAPTFGRLEMTTVNATRADDPVATTVKNGAKNVSKAPQSVYVLDLEPGKHQFSANAPGYCEVNREFEVSAGKITKTMLPLSPDLKPGEIARFVLNWRNEPSDLDTHFWRRDTTSFPSPTKVYFENKVGVMPNGQTFARLDVDKQYPGAYETLTVRDAAEGAFRYYIHVYRGQGTIGDAHASVQIYTPGCRVRTLNPPPPCAFRIWEVAVLTNGAGGMQINDTQHCEPEGTIFVGNKP